MRGLIGEMSLRVVFGEMLGDSPGEETLAIFPSTVLSETLAIEGLFDRLGEEALIASDRFGSGSSAVLIF